MLAPDRRSIAWTETGDAWTPYRASVDGECWELRYPTEAYGPNYRLVIGGRVVQDIPEWPESWSRPIRALVAGPCPVDFDLYLVTALEPGGPVLLYCPDCCCAWPSLRASETEPDRTLDDYGLSEQTIRYVTEPEARVAGLSVQKRVGIPHCQLPRVAG